MHTFSSSSSCHKKSWQRLLLLFLLSLVEREEEEKRGGGRAGRGRGGERGGGVLVDLKSNEALSPNSPPWRERERERDLCLSLSCWAEEEQAILTLSTFFFNWASLGREKSYFVIITKKRIRREPKKAFLPKMQTSYCLVLEFNFFFIEKDVQPLPYSSSWLFLLSFFLFSHSFSSSSSLAKEGWLLSATQPNLLAC